MTVQLAFELDTEVSPAPVRMTGAQAGLRRDCPPGAERLLAALVKRGLPHEHLHAAAALVLALEQGADAKE